MLSSLLLLPVALGLTNAAALSTRNEPDAAAPQELLLRYHHETASNQTELLLSTQDKSTVFAHACGDTFEIGGKTVTFSVNEIASGTISVDGKVYKAVGDREKSGGIACEKMYNDRSVIVECSIPWRESFDDLETISANDADSCFPEEVAVRRRNLPNAFTHPFDVVGSELEKRQGPYGCWGGSYRTETENVGDGNPHQDYLHQQVGPSQKCAERGTCFVGVGQEVSITVSAEIGLGGGSWITGGFGVSKTKSSSTERGCYGEAGDTVCQWTKSHHTAYTVIQTTYGTCNSVSKDVSDPYVIRSPNDNSMAIEWYCVLNHCRGDGDRYWELGRAGGP